MTSPSSLPDQTTKIDPLPPYANEKRTFKLPIIKFEYIESLFKQLEDLKRVHKSNLNEQKKLIKRIQELYPIIAKYHKLLLCLNEMQIYLNTENSRTEYVEQKKRLLIDNIPNQLGILVKRPRTEN